jgi:hypothetical protein
MVAVYARLAPWGVEPMSTGRRSALCGLRTASMDMENASLGAGEGGSASIAAEPRRE